MLLRSGAQDRATEELQSSLLLAVKEEAECELEDAAKSVPNAKRAQHANEEKAEPPQKKQRTRKAAALLKKLLDESSAERLQEVMALQKSQLASIDAAVAEAMALEVAKSEETGRAQQELDAATETVEEALSEETIALTRIGDLKARRHEAALKSSQKMLEMQETRQFLQLVQSSAQVAQKVKEVKEQRKASELAALKARRKHQEILAETKRKLDELRFSNTKAMARSPFQLALGTGNNRPLADAKTPEQKVRREGGLGRVTPVKHAVAAVASEEDDTKKAESEGLLGRLFE
eukprot:TRINITY_DN6536_c0_g1_i1.p1 TRINITY_DN6536_c0_g1~~TRINITY_DN6536_c0_g1_i1.p1  ORF type:complete len:292 (-),score=82.62 TRINITY_DN6536_c0_g1_i1:93-968(-)